MNSNCPICDARVSLAANTEVSEIVSCTDCQSRLVVAGVSGGSAILQQAPAVEEDWGE